MSSSCMLSIATSDLVLVINSAVLLKRPSLASGMISNFRPPLSGFVRFCADPSAVHRNARRSACPLYSAPRLHERCLSNRECRS